MQRAAAAGLALGILMVVHPAWGVHFEKVTEETQKQVPSQGQIGPDAPQVSASLDADAELAQLTVLVEHQIDCSVVCDTPECSASFDCTNTTVVVFEIFPDEGETVGQPVPLCVRHVYDLEVSTTGNFTALAAVGGVPDPTVDPTLVIRTPGGTEFSNGPVVITSGQQSDRLFKRFVAQIGDIIEIRLGTHSEGEGSGIGSASTDVLATLQVFSCEPAPAPVFSAWGGTAVCFLLLACGLLGIRRQRRDC